MSSTRKVFTSLPGRLRDSFSRWAQTRHLPGAQTLLAHRNIYILPTPAGWFFGLTLLLLLVASINYQLNLGYLLTFLLAGSALASLQITHKNLRGVELVAHMSEDAQLHAGHLGSLGLRLHSPGRQRWGVQLATDKQGWHALDLGCDATARFTLPWTPARRGTQLWPLMMIETRYPLGLWRAWSVWQPAVSLCVYPTPECPAPSPPSPMPAPASGQSPQRSSAGDDFDELRPYQRGDPLKHVVWKRGATEDLIVRAATPSATRLENWLDWADLPAALAVEARLSRLCAWVLIASQRPQSYGLRLPGRVIPPGNGTTHTRQCLCALAGFAIVKAC